MRPIQELCLLKRENAIGSTVYGSRASYKVDFVYRQKSVGGRACLTQKSEIIRLEFENCSGQ